MLSSAKTEFPFTQDAMTFIFISLFRIFRKVILYMNKLY